MTLREQLMAGLAARLLSIKAVNGYRFSVNDVVRTQVDLPDHPPMPCIYIYEGEEEKRKDSGRLLCELQIGIVYIAEDLTDQNTTANEMLHDVSRAMGTDFIITDEDGISRSVEIFEQGNDVTIGPTNNQVIYVAMTFVASYYHQHGDQTRG
jgi:hypothetical protein